MPIFMPDATYGAVRALGAADLEACGVEVVMTNAFHLAQRPGTTTVRALGGIHRMLGFNGLVATDSGGFQAFSLIRQNEQYGRITEGGLVFYPDGGGRLKLSPENAINNQLRLGSDILFCLDDCTHPDDPQSEQEASVRRTIAWAKACKSAFTAQLAQRRMDGRQPRLFAVVQGGRQRGVAARMRRSADRNRI